MTEFLTKEGFEKLKEELKILETERRREVSEKLNQAILQGDLSENAAYEAAKEEQGFVEGKIRELRDILGQAAIISGKSNGKVKIGSTVVLQSKDGRNEFLIVGPEEADILKNKISFKSPLGSAIFGKQKGDLVEVNTPSGKKQYKVVGIK